MSDRFDTRHLSQARGESAVQGLPIARMISEILALYIEARRDHLPRLKAGLEGSGFLGDAHEENREVEQAETQCDLRADQKSIKLRASRSTEVALAAFEHF